MAYVSLKKAGTSRVAPRKRKGGLAPEFARAPWSTSSAVSPGRAGQHTSHDSLEREADSVADKVMRTPKTASGMARSVEGGPKVRAAGGPTKSTPFDAEISAARQAGGSPLSPGLRAFMEPRFGVDFGEVRVHAGATAASLTQKLHARAFTTANDVFFAAGEFEPQKSESRWLLAHELSHTLQQKQGSPQIQRSPPKGCQVPDLWWSYIPTLPKKFFESLKEVDGPTKITLEDVDALTREDLRALRNALQNYVEHRKCAGQAEAMYYYHEKLLTDIVGPRVERVDNFEAAPDRLDDWIFHVVEKLALGDVERAILMQCAPYIHRRMNEIVAGTPLTPVSDSEIEQVGYFNSTAVEAVDRMTMAEVKSKQKAGGLRDEFRRNYMTNAATQIIRGIPNSGNVHVDYKHPGLERGGSFGDMMSILRTIKDEMRAGLAVVRRVRNMLGTSAADGVEKPAMQLNDYISALQQTEGTLYTVDYERGSESANIDYARRIEVATLREIWPNTGSAASEE